MSDQVQLKVNDKTYQMSFDEARHDGDVRAKR